MVIKYKAMVTLWIRASTVERGQALSAKYRLDRDRLSFAPVTPRVTTSKQGNWMKMQDRSLSGAPNVKVAQLVEQVPHRCTVRWFESSL